MRFAMVSEHASPLAVLGGVDAGGQNVHVADLARALARHGTQVVVHTRRDDPSLPRRVPFGPGVTVDHVDAGPAAPLPKDELLPHMGAFARDLRRQWEVAPPDVVHSHFWMSGLAATAAGRAADVPILHTYHALGVVKRRHQGAADPSPAERIACEQQLALDVDRVVATSADERRELIALGAPGDRISVVPCGVDLARFRPDVPDRMPPGGTRPRVVVVSRLVERKGIGNVIEAVAALPDVELVIAGGPPAGLVDVDPHACRYRRMIADLGVEERVRLLGAVDRAEVPDLLRSASVVACCPWYEPFGLVAVEAMACGVPVVASAVGGLAETVHDGVTGLLVPPRSPDRIAAALARLLAGDAERRAMGRAGVVRAERYSWDRVAAETLAVARSVLADRSAPAPVAGVL
jgi:glycosyltransferase involved in cell wall biosynthesis